MPDYGVQRSALEDMLTAMADLGRLEDVDAALVAICRGMADELDTSYERSCPECGESLTPLQPSARNSMMWKHYGEAVGVLLASDVNDDELAALAAQLQAPMGDPPEGGAS